MGNKRNIINEISHKRIRADYMSRTGCDLRFGQIESLINRLDFFEEDTMAEILRYIPVSLIATIETYYRCVFQELIDKGEPYFSNTIKYLKQQSNIKFDLDFLIALQGKQVTVGEIFAHLLQVNNINDINAILSAILGDDFFSKLKDSKVSEVGYLKEESRKFKFGFGKYLESVVRIFEYRHILAHEFALNIDLKKDVIIQDFKNLKYFIGACNYCIDKTTGDFFPMMFQHDLTMHSYDQFELADLELKGLISIIRKLERKGDFFPKMDGKLFSQAIKEWRKYRKTMSKSHSDPSTGGSMGTTLYYSEMEALTRQMISNLKDHYSHLFRAKSI